MDKIFIPLHEELRKIRHVVMDMDGTIYHGNKLFPTTLPFLERLKKLGIGFTFLTNNSSRSTDVYLEHLHRFGIHVPRECMLSSTGNTVDYLQRHHPGIRRLFLLGTDSFRAEMRASGFTDCSMEEEPELVVTAFDTSLLYERLCKCAWWIKHGKPWIATHCDLECPTEKPTTLIDCGSVTACLEAVSGRKPVVMGKPNRTMMETIFHRYSLMPEEVVMCGDRAYTDIQLAVNSGTFSAMIVSESQSKTGIPADSTPPGIVRPVPTWVIPHLEKLGEALSESRD